MNNELSESYLEIYAKDLLKEIKLYVRKNGIKLKKEKKTDKKMIEVIKDLCKVNNDESNSKSIMPLVLIPLKTEEDVERVKCTLILFYTALYTDDLKLLNKLYDDEYDFGNRKNNLDLFIFDKRLSKWFEEEEYAKLIENKTELLRNFYYSLLFYDDIKMDEDECIKEFATIVKENPNVADIKKGYFEQRKIMHRVITKKTISYFGSRFLLDITYEQKKNIIDNIYESLNEEEIERIKDLLKDPNFSLGWYTSTKEILKNFTNEELKMINDIERDLFVECHGESLSDVNYEEIKNIIYNRTQPEKPKERKKRYIHYHY
ncbi:MAG: hypothetical protein VZS44_06735 [Bacilli bacterium]|nr:hypothetical protein [Bacilli bacterium]